MSLMLALLLTTTTFRDNATVPPAVVAVRCGGRNLSPALAWTAPPTATRSFALIVHDPDAPHPDGFYHWVAYNIPASLRALAAGRGRFGDGMDGRNDATTIGYFGPCPPPGKLHHYRFTLYALDVARIDAPHPLTAHELQTRLRGHVLAQSTITGLWSATSLR